jgi:hypothetical protein
MKSLKTFLSIAALTGALTLSASATFIVNTDPGGKNLFIDMANKNLSDFQGFVGANNSFAPRVGIHTMGNEFSLAGGHVVPDSGPTAMLLGGGLAAIVLVRRYLKR